MSGKDFIAVRRISTLEDDTLADVGATCERVPESDLGWLSEQGHIVPVGAATPDEIPATPEEE